MNVGKDFIAGTIFILITVLLVWWVGGQAGLLRVGIAVFVAWIALYLLSKTGAMNLKPDLLVRFLMPRKYRKALKDLEETEKKE